MFFLFLLDGTWLCGIVGLRVCGGITVLANERGFEGNVVSVCMTGAGQKGISLERTVGPMKRRKIIKSEKINRGTGQTHDKDKQTSVGATQRRMSE